jgi:hypothetical protein
MRPLRYGILIASSLGALWYVLPFRVFWSFDHIEQHAKKVITAAELQAWATNLLTRYPTNSTPRVSELGTNFPPQLLGLYRHSPYVQISEEESTNNPACVYLMWGGGMIGHCGFEIGETNFVSYRSHARAWQPGVYFWSEYPPKLHLNALR